MVYHGYENGFRTLGRQTLLAPVEWTPDGWFRVLGGDLSRPMAKPGGGRAGPSGRPLSDDFSVDRMGVQWAFHDPAADEAGRAVYEPGGLRIRGRGASPADSSPLTCIVGDRGYEVEITLELQGEVEAGLLLFYNHKAFVGLGFTASALKTFEYSEELTWARQSHDARAMRLRIGNDGNVVTYHYSYDAGRTWRRHDTRMEVSGLHHNVFGGFLSLQVGVYSAGDGAVVLKDFTYRALTKT
jgi:xylan 1,4-beta-xylosidase